MSARPIKYTNEILRDELNRLKAVLGRPPGRSDIEQHSTISPDTFERHFGRWKQLDMFRQLELEHPSEWTVDSLTQEQGGWLAGFFCGEGYFRLKYLHQTRTNFDINTGITVRDDDAELLEFVKECWQLSEPVKIFSNDRRRAKGEKCGDEAKLYIRDVETIYYKVLPTFRKYPLHGKKGREFEIFALAIELLHEKRQQGRRNRRFTEDESIQLTDLMLRLNDTRQHPIFRSSKANR